MIEPERIRTLNSRSERRTGEYVLYWMQQSQRAEGNPALERAVELAGELARPVLVAFALTDDEPMATERQYLFMLEGLAETREALRRRGISMVVRRGDPPDVIAGLARDAAVVVSDRGYMPIQVEWRRRLSDACPVRLEQVEGDVVVPVEVASDHEEFAARTLRPKLLRHLGRYLRPPDPPTAYRPAAFQPPAGEEWESPAELLKRLRVDRSVGPSPAIRGGLSEARRRLRRFLDGRLAEYPERRNDPTVDIQSGLSPYLHFGQISVVEVAWAAHTCEAPRAARDAFLEELVVRRELSMNFARYNPRCAAWEGLPAWARATLEAHAGDPRPFLYSAGELEAAATHDPAWNAAQREMTVGGKMHNYMRMYWGKKILEWTADPQEAFATALRLNDRYELDGRDPNGCAGVAWCFGKHDRPWAERPIFGTVRYMSFEGLRRKFDIDEYIRRWAPSR